MVAVRKLFVFTVLILAIGFLALESRASNEHIATNAPAEKRILFIGNSLTGGNNLAGLVRALAAKKAVASYVEAHVEFGKTLRDHLQNADLKNAIVKDWDVIVFQEYSVVPLENEASFRQSVLDLKALVVSPATQILLFQNWPVKDAPSNTIKSLDAVYSRVAAEAGAKVVPVGRAFDFIKRNTTLPLYTDDKHPTLLATYLTALMFDFELFGLNPLEMPTLASRRSTDAYTDGVAPLTYLFDLKTQFSQSALAGIQETVRATSAGEAPNISMFQFGLNSRFAF